MRMLFLGKTRKTYDSGVVDFKVQIRQQESVVVFVAAKKIEGVPDSVFADRHCSTHP